MAVSPRCFPGNCSPHPSLALPSPPLTCPPLPAGQRFSRACAEQKPRRVDSIALWALGCFSSQK